MRARPARLRAMRRLFAVATAALSVGVLAAIITWRSTTDLSPRLQDLAYAPVFCDAGGAVHLVRPAIDGQVRLPVSCDTAGPWIVPATIAAEDVRFGRHPGVDPRAILRAAWVNLRSGRRAEGASTMAMQVAKMLDPQPRTFASKVSEALRALKLTERLDDDAVVEAYLTLAPYGGNRVGAEAAARAYFGRALADLSLGEAALLAGLPRSPERLRPDRHPAAAAARRDRVLERMVKAGFITEAQGAEARSVVPILHGASSGSPPSPVVLLAEARRPGGGTLTIRGDVQHVSEEAIDRMVRRVGAGAHGAVAVLDVDRSEWVALAVSAGDADHPAQWMPLFAALRSPGSALKPFIYAAAIEAGRLDGESPVPDRATDFAGWRPRNFAGDHAQWTTAADALRRSLNLPAIHLLRAIGVETFAAHVRSAGLSIDDRSIARAGLGLAVGTVEVRLTDLTAAYALFARDGVHSPPRLFVDEAASPEVRVLSARTARMINEMLSSEHRAPAALAHLAGEDRPWMMWKTGTSAGHRDAWAIGHNGRYAVGVWIGRPTGESIADLTGGQAAEPVLAELLAHPLLRGAASLQRDREIVSVQSDRSVVTHAIDWEHAPQRSLMVAPRDGAVHVALEGHAVIPLQASAPVRWLLDAAPVSAETDVLWLPPGRYELLAVARDGRTQRREVVVVAPQ